jgi:hypothetical protein
MNKKNEFNIDNRIDQILNSIAVKTVNNIKWLVFTMLGIVLSFLWTVALFQDLSNKTSEANIQWFMIAFFVDILKGCCGGMALYELAHIDEFKTLDKSELGSKIIRLIFTIAIFGGALYISINGSAGALLLSHQDKEFSNYKNSEVTTQIKKLEDEQSQNNITKNSLHTQLIEAQKNDKTIDDNNKALQDSKNSNINDLNKRIKQQEAIIAEQNELIRTANSQKPPKLHGTADMLKSEAEKNKNSLENQKKELLSGLSTITATTTNQDIINKKIDEINVKNDNLSKQIEDIKSGKDQTLNKNIKKTALQLLYPDETKRKGFEDFISWFIEVGTLLCSFMWTNIRKKRKGISPDPAKKKIDDDKKDTSLKIPNSWSQEAKKSSPGILTCENNINLKPDFQVSKVKVYENITQTVGEIIFDIQDGCYYSDSNKDKDNLYIESDNALPGVQKTIRITQCGMSESQFKKAQQQLANDGILKLREGETPLLIADRNRFNKIYNVR